MKRAFGLLILVGVLRLVNPIPASAIGQPVFLGPFHQQGTALIADCGTFQVMDAYQGELSIMAFLDKDGNPDRAIIDFRGTDTFFSSVTGKSFTETFHNKEFANLTAQDGLQPVKLAKVGIIYRLTVPGHGAVFLEVGRAVFTPGHIEFEAGQHQAVDGDIAGLCAAIA
jgi:hypothetical protein